MTVSRAFVAPPRSRRRPATKSWGSQLQSATSPIAPPPASLPSEPGRSASSSRRCRDSIYLPFVEGARRVFEANGCDYLLQSIDYTKGRETHAIASLLAHRVQAILLPSIGHTAATAGSSVRSRFHSLKWAICRRGHCNSPSAIRTSKRATSPHAG